MKIALDTPSSSNCPRRNRRESIRVSPAPGRLELALSSFMYVQRKGAEFFVKGPISWPRRIVNIATMYSVCSFVQLAFIACFRDFLM